MRSFVGFLVILLVSVITVDCLFTLGVVERALDRSKTAQMLANRSSVKSIQDIKNLEKKFACFKKEAKTTLESFLAMVLRIFDVVLAKAIVLFWKLKNMLEEYYAAAADTRRRERRKPSSSSSPPSTTDSKKER